MSHADIRRHIYVVKTKCVYSKLNVFTFLQLAWKGADSLAAPEEAEEDAVASGHEEEVVAAAAPAPAPASRADPKREARRRAMPPLVARAVGIVERQGHQYKCCGVRGRDVYTMGVPLGVRVWMAWCVGG